MPTWASVWLTIMIFTFLIGIFFVRRHGKARWVVGGFVAMIVVTVATGRILGLVPLSDLFSLVYLICWSPALYVPLKRRPFLQERPAFSIWSGAITACIIFFLCFGMPDAVIYLDHMPGIGLFPDMPTAVGRIV